jgi:hypothetical protein
MREPEADEKLIDVKPEVDEELMPEVDEKLIDAGAGGR